MQEKKKAFQNLNAPVSQSNEPKAICKLPIKHWFDDLQVKHLYCLFNQVKVSLW